MGLYEKAIIGFDTVDSLLVFARDNDLGCTITPATEFDHHLFSGKYQILHSCSSGDLGTMSFQMIGVLKANPDYFFQVSIVMVNPNDMGAADEILRGVSVATDLY